VAHRFEAFERGFLIRPHQARIPRHVGGEDRSVMRLPDVALNMSAVIPT
jgi:hypothetical protein